MVYVEVLDNEEGGHTDLVFQIQGLTERLVFDTYYFVLAIEPVEDQRVIKRFVATYLEAWVAEIEQMKDGEERAFPIDISDQYVGCLKVQYNGPQLKLAYGFSTMVQGWGMDLKAPQKYFTAITDFRSDIPRPLTTDRSALIQSLLHQIARLKGESPFASHH
ncbi:MAG: hypothetical protein KF797_09545 [Flavobacteriales bacterium]|nr:hypothetical protein [Flavobacteriales bacterium]